MWWALDLHSFLYITFLQAGDKNVVVSMAIQSIPLTYFLSAIMGPLCLSKFLLFVSRSPLLLWSTSKLACLLSSFLLSPKLMCCSWSLLLLLWPRFLGGLRFSPAWSLAWPQSRPLSCPQHPKREFPLPTCVSRLAVTQLQNVPHQLSELCRGLGERASSKFCIFQKYLPSHMVFLQCDFDILPLLESV